MSLLCIGACCIGTSHIAKCTWEETLMVDLFEDMELISLLVVALVVIVCCLFWLILSYAAARALCSSSV